ncbi:GTP 3',8-cyclase MoaA, partial [Candidatus Desantisbacteria bacterium CG_4_10_14_0_8_um_filter_39_17]
MLSSNPNYLRISVTDYCNLNCIYCKSRDYLHLSREEVLSFEEIAEFVRLTTEWGIEKVRITGGEPLIKKDILILLEMLREISALKNLCLTTNGVNLKEFAPSLKKIGIDSVNVSLDTLNPGKFISITGKNELQNVLDGITTARDLGILVKINVVMLKDINDAEIIDFLRFARDNSLILRFIEYMPVGKNFNEEWFLSNILVKNKIEDYIGLLEPYSIFNSESSGPAKYYKNSGLIVGFISARSEPFCSNCNRIRLTIDGKLHSCLFSLSEFN